jgi:hypothetical protein
LSSWRELRLASQRARRSAEREGGSYGWQASEPAEARSAKRELRLGKLASRAEARSAKAGGRRLSFDVVLIAAMIVVIFVIDLGRRWWREYDWKRRWRDRDND